ncbi:hypothetical protein IGI39_004274 [Enterococcus sp. AZ135]|uniref:AraC family transcriptional regulator n=1 Tax=unclassified Enterococcus TaxID=2608891 RepID=UPI003F2205CF
MYEANEMASLVEAFNKYEKMNGIKGTSYLANHHPKDCAIGVKKYDSSFNGVRHFYDYFEIKYVLSGEVNLVVNNKEVRLKEGQMILIDKKCGQEIDKINVSTILIGFLFQKNDTSIHQLSILGREENSLTYEYLNDNFLHAGSKSAYLVIDSTKNIELKEGMRSLIDELSAMNRNSELINSLVEVLFHRLARIYYLKLTKIYLGKEINWTIVTVLKKIENDYASLSLACLSEEMGYNKNYLSNLIKEKTGKTFKTLISEIRVKKAYELIIKTDLPIN